MMDPPIINPNWLTVPTDVDLAIAASNAFAGSGGTLKREFLVLKDFEWWTFLDFHF
jgi:hypothetical protein